MVCITSPASVTIFLIRSSGREAIILFFLDLTKYRYETKLFQLFSISCDVSELYKVRPVRGLSPLSSLYTDAFYFGCTSKNFLIFFRR